VRLTGKDVTPTTPEAHPVTPGTHPVTTDVWKSTNYADLPQNGQTTVFDGTGGGEVAERRKKVAHGETVGGQSERLKPRMER
jgi:hypothetical protein